MVCAGRVFPVHRAVLSTACPVLQGAFGGAMREGQTASYEFKDTTPEAVEALLCHFYTKAAPEPGATDPVPVIKLAIQYGATELAESVAEDMAEHVTEDTVVPTSATLPFRHS